MIELSERIIDDEIARAPYLHTEIDIVERDRKLLSESADLIVNALLHHKACGCDRREILLADDPVLIAGLSPVLIYERMTRDSAPSDNNTGVLDRIVLIIESCADSSDIISAAETEHLADDIVADELSVIIEQEEVLAFGLFGSEIVDRGEIESAFIVDDFHAVISCRKVPVIEECLLLGRIILDDDDLKVRVAHTSVDALLFKHLSRSSM